MRLRVVVLVALAVATTVVATAADDCVRALDAGAWHSLALRVDGSLAAWGGGELGQLGIATANDSPWVQVVAPQTSYTAVAAGEWHSTALRPDGTVVAWGINPSGQLGDGTRDYSRTPVEVVGLADVTSICAGGWHSLALSTDGSVRGWGQNALLQVFNRWPPRGDSLVPIAILRADRSGPLVTASAIACGLVHSLALDANGSVHVFGGNARGQLGLGTVSESSIGIVPGLDRVVAVAAGGLHSIAITDDGVVWTWGGNGHGQLGIGSTDDRSSAAPAAGFPTATRVAGGGNHTLVLATDGRVWASGYNRYGQLGDGTTVDAASPFVVPGLTGIVAIAAGRHHSLALGGDGTVWGWGMNEHGELAGVPGPLVTRPTPLVGVCATCSIAADLAHVRPIELGATATLDASLTTAAGCSVGGLEFQFEQGATVLRGWDAVPRFDVAPTSRARYRVRVRCAAVPSCETFAETSVGVIPGRGCEIVAIESGGHFAMALESNGMVWAWGYNRHGAVGMGSTVPDEIPTPTRVTAVTDVVQIAAGYEAGYVLDPDGRVWVWGFGWHGSLGDGRSDFPPLALSVEPVLVPELKDVVEIDASGSNALAIKRDGSVWGWGRGDYGQLGDGVFLHQTDTTPAIPMVALHGAVAVAAGGDAGNMGYAHSLLLHADGTVDACGRGLSGELGTGAFLLTPPLGVVRSQVPDRVVAIAAGTLDSMALDDVGRVWTFGGNVAGNLGNGTYARSPTPARVPGLFDVTAISINWVGQPSMALLRSGVVRTWGWNTEGQLGDGTTTDSPVPVGVVGLTDVVRISSGDPVLAQTADGALWSWGTNAIGQLGTGVVGGYSSVPVRVLEPWNPPAPDVARNSLRAVKSGGDAVFTWATAVVPPANWNLHRTAVKADLPTLWTIAPLVAATDPIALDPTPPPGPAQPWLYQAFGADCHGVSAAP